jgi:peptide/nickel transport system permease protein
MSTTTRNPLKPSPGFLRETWRRLLQRRIAVVALLFVAFLTLVAILSPAIAGRKPIVCRYKGQLYFPALSYFRDSWQNPIFFRDKFRDRFGPDVFKKKDPDSWVIYPLTFNDPYSRIKENEWPDRPGNPRGDEAGPSAQNWFGTDESGVDVFAKMVHGTRIALLVGFVSMGIATAIGLTVGGVSGYFGGRIDAVLSRLTEVILCVPTLILILAVFSLIREPSIWHTMAIIGATSWPGISRLTRAEFLKIKQSDYVAAARVSGISTPKIILRYILPNALAPVLVPVTFGIASAILTESGLSFLGIGAPPPNASWGSLLSSATNNYKLWWVVVYPGLAVFLTVLAYNVIGEALQEATDPRLREGGR